MGRTVISSKDVQSRCEEELRRIREHHVLCRWCHEFRTAFYGNRMDRHERIECSQRPGAGERKLLECPYCKEWFNTTLDILFEHKVTCDKRSKPADTGDDEHCCCCCY